jgi:hypothetical protein
LPGARLEWTGCSGLYRAVDFFANSAKNNLASAGRINRDLPWVAKLCDGSLKRKLAFFYTAEKIMIVVENE